jgi:nucleoside 2-deoxyribosyltransferase
MKIYFAAPIFTQAHQMFNEYVAQKIEERFPDVELYVPQRNTSINDKTKCATAEDICVGDFDNNLNSTDIVVALVDGDTPPIGTTLEIGYFSRMCQEEMDRNGFTNKKIISLYTDTRECSTTVNDAKKNMLSEFAECQFSYINLLLVGALKRYGKMCRTVDDLIDELDKAIIAYK